MQQKLHISSFLQGLKFFLKSNSLTLEQFLAKRGIDSNQLTKKDFNRILPIIPKRSYKLKHQDVFKQLGGKDKIIYVSNLKKIMGMLDNTFTLSSEIRQEQRIKQDERNKKLTRKSIQLLKQYLQELSDPVAFLHKFDLDQNGSIDKAEFTKLLIATEIGKFTHKQFRKIVVEYFFNKFGRQEISCSQLCHYFGIKENKISSKFIQKTQNKFIKLSQNNSIKFQNDKITSQQMYDFDDNQNQKAYPLSMGYYRLGEPQIFEYQVLDQLQRYLKNKIQFRDQQNPKIEKGNYVPATTIFNNGKYKLFQNSQKDLVQDSKNICIVQQIQPNDIKQGQIADCYLISSIASLINIHPQIITELFLFEVNESNFYAVKLFVDGQWKVVTTDSNFPCDGKIPIYVRPLKNQIWILLLEKIWAKEFGSYNAIANGYAREAFIAMTGAPCQILFQDQFQDQEKLKKQLESIQKQRYVAIVNTSKKIQKLEKQGFQKYGLVAQHSYSFLKISQNFVQIRNPWGNTTCKDNQSYGSEKWTKQLKDRYQNPKNGSFYMKLIDFRKYFSQIIICKLDPNYVHDSIRAKTNQHKSAYFSMQVKKSGKYTVSIYQANQKKMKLQYPNYQYSQARIIILKKSGKQMQYIGSKVSSQKQVCSVQMRLTEGEYVISAKVVWKIQKESSEMVVTSYGPEHVQILPLDRQIAVQFKRQMIQSYARKFSDPTKIQVYNQKKLKVKWQTNINQQTGIGFVKMVNQSQKGFKCEYQAVEIKNIKLIKPAKFPLIFKMKKQERQKVYGFFVNPLDIKYNIIPVLYEHD